MREGGRWGDAGARRRGSSTHHTARTRGRTAPQCQALPPHTTCLRWRPTTPQRGGARATPAAARAVARAQSVAAAARRAATRARRGPRPTAAPPEPPSPYTRHRCPWRRRRRRRRRGRAARGTAQPRHPPARRPPQRRCRAPAPRGGPRSTPPTTLPDEEPVAGARVAAARARAGPSLRRSRRLRAGTAAPPPRAAPAARTPPGSRHRPTSIRHEASTATGSLAFLGCFAVPQRSLSFARHTACAHHLIAIVLRFPVKSAPLKRGVAPCGGGDGLLRVLRRRQSSGQCGAARRAPLRAQGHPFLVCRVRHRHRTSVM